MNEIFIKDVLAILRDSFGFDKENRVEFILALERRTGEIIPDEWTNIM